MGKLITDPKEVPASSHYVLMRDTFLSNRGPAEGKDSIHIYPCDGEQQASVVVANAHARGDQDQVKMVTEVPDFAEGCVYSLIDPEQSTRWYEPGGFAEHAL